MAFNRLHVNDLATATLDDSDQVIIGESNTFKKATVSVLKNKILGSSPSYTTDTEPYLMRQTAHTGVVGKCALNKLVGGSLGWNQLAQGNTVNTTINGVSFVRSTAETAMTINGTATATATWFNSTTASIVQGHVYLLIGALNNKIFTNMTGVSLWNNTNLTDVGSGGLMRATGSGNSTLAVTVTSGTTASNVKISPQLFDITAMFGSTIADYVLSLGVSNCITWLSKYIDLGTYHAYDAGSVQSVQATAHVTTGKNLMPQQTDGIIPCFLPKGAHICASCTTPTGATPNLNYYDANRNRIDYWPLTQTYSGGLYRSFVVVQDAYYIAFTNNTALNKQLEFGSSPTAYEPYTEHVYPLGSDTLRGYPMLVNNKLAFDGDEKYPDGTIRRKYGIVDLGTLTYTGDSGGFVLSESIGAKVQTTQAVMAKIICSKYPTIMQSQLSGSDKCVYGLNWGNGIGIRDSAYSTPAAFKTAMSGVYLVYELATETTESSTAYQHIQTIDADGTESFTTSSPVPVGHETQTPDNILAALSWVGE